MYLGASEVKHDAMIFVTGAGINPRNYSPELALMGDEKPPELEPEHDPLAPPGGLPIPERIWTAADGKTMRATGVYEVGSDYVNLMINKQWIEYPLENLSEEDRAAMLLAKNFNEE